MELIKQTGEPTCMLASLAMCTGVPYKEVLQVAIDNGVSPYDKVFNRDNDLDSLRGTTLPDLVYIADNLGFALVPWHFTFEMKNGKGDSRIETRDAWCEKILGDRQGILIMHRHACAWDCEQVYDPKGFTAPIEEYNPIAFYEVLDRQITDYRGICDLGT